MGISSSEERQRDPDRFDEMISEGPIGGDPEGDVIGLMLRDGSSYPNRTPRIREIPRAQGGDTRLLW